MASRPVFVPADGRVDVVDVDFEWFPGFARSQKVKSIRSLHAAAPLEGALLEVSSKSEEELGVALSAFNLLLDVPEAEVTVPVEVAYQAGKVFAASGRQADLLANPDPRSAKARAASLADEGLVAFEFDGRPWPLQPPSLFYDYLYFHGLVRLLDERPELDASLRGYAGFTDIEFNPSRAVSCQARSCALFCSVESREAATLVADPGLFIDHFGGFGEGHEQEALF